MLEKILQFDTDLFLFLNNLGSENWDGFWLFITKQAYWTPFFVFLLYLIQKKYGWKQTGLIVLTIAILITITDQTTNHLFKFRFERLRPCSNPELEGLMRAVKTSKTFSFISGHASNSMAGCFFIFLLLKKYYRFAWLLFLWPLVFAYSRIYLGLHFPSDIICGYIWGIFTSSLVYYTLYKYWRNH